MAHLRLWAIAFGWVALAVLCPLQARAQALSQWVSPGPLAQDHAHLEGLNNCTQCHSPMLGVTTELCVACHEEVGRQVKTATGFHRNKGNRCGDCHPDHLGRDYQLARLEMTRLEHLKETGFPLDGAHGHLDCTDCHTEGKWGEVEEQCRACHDHPHGETEHVDVLVCESCHDTERWDVRQIAEAVFDHADPDQTDYVLEGGHVGVACVDCHLEARFEPTDFEECTSCHDNPHRSSRFSNDCESCHTLEDWVVDPFDHRITGYSLEGLHGDVACAKCHGTDVTRRVKHETCEDCHKDPHRQQFTPRTCDACHTVTLADFRIPTFEHDTTAWPLEGHHTEVACAECHGTGPKATYVPVAHADCDDCHEDVHAGKFEPTDCAACHVPTDWGVAGFDHDRTSFPLNGKHVDATCEQCHPNEQWSGIAYASCLDCHEDQPHADEFAAETCVDCHVETGWAEVTYAHATRTEFDLEPQHGAIPCKDCHPTMDDFAQPEATCRGCHEEDPKPAGHYEGACESCHRGAHWLPADLGDNPHEVTGFALVGTHSQLACEDCHGAQVPLSAGGTDCADCHADDDAHRHLLGDVCEDCHGTTTWARTSFRHATTGWPLRGAHRLAACDDCHAVRYVGTPDDCWRCHESEAPRSEPAHQSAFFARCDECHRPYTWSALPTATLAR